MEAKGAQHSSVHPTAARVIIVRTAHILVGCTVVAIFTRIGIPKTMKKLKITRTLRGLLLLLSVIISTSMLLELTQPPHYYLQPAFVPTVARHSLPAPVP